MQIILRLAGALCAALLMSMTAAGAQDRDTVLRDALLGTFESQVAAVERYAVENGRRAFVLDRSTEPALLRFDGSAEVFALTATPAARGDVVYQDDTGTAFVRLTDLGGVTLYPRERRAGVPALRLEASAPIAPASGDERALTLALSDLRSALTDLAGQPVSVSVDSNATPGSLPAIADAVRVTEIGVRRAVRSGVRVSLDAVAFRFAAGPEAAVREATLHIGIDPARGYAGRPSSNAVEAVLGAN